MERLCARVQQQVCALRAVKDKEEVQAAKQVLKEARNSRAVSGTMQHPRVAFVFSMLYFANAHTCTPLSLQLYPSLCELAHVLSVDGPVRQKLDSLAGELTKAADKELQVVFASLHFLVLVPAAQLSGCWIPTPPPHPQVIVDSMVALCRELCPLSAAAAERLSPPLSSISERVSIPRSAIRTALMERAAQDVHRALE